jgi:peptide/nickel transport system substrate-binding protein
MWSGILSGNLDFIIGNQSVITKNMLEGGPEYVEEFRKKRFGGMSLIPQHEDSQLGDLAVRKAIAYLVDRKAVAGNVSSITQDPAPLLTSLASSVQERWLGDLRDKMTVYGKRSKPNEAKRVLEEAGYTREDDSWYDPDDEPVSIPIHAPLNIGSWVTAARTVSSQLTDFGIDAELSADDVTSYWPTYREGRFEKMVCGFWGHPAAKLPYFQLWLSLLRRIPGEACNYPVTEAPVPMPVGESRAETETVNLEELITEMEVLGDESALEANVRTVAWAYNQTLPQIPVLQGIHQTIARRDKWEFPPKGNQLLTGYLLEKNRLPYFLLRRGKLRAVK